jgi:glyoxylase-like metal-dependent hydrolase (beta-lactamase superfamily II)
MIQVRILVFNPFSENTYIASDETGECVIIDPGCGTAGERKALESAIEKNRLKPVKIINTHCHIDHILGCAFVKSAYSIPFLVHSLELPLLASAAQQRAIFGLEEGETPEPDLFVGDGDTIEFGKSGMTVLHIPGHSPGGISLVSRENKIAFTGDTLFQGSIGRSDLPGGDHNLLVRSIKDKLLILDPATVLYPGHGPETTVGEEKENNPFLV